MIGFATIKRFGPWLLCLYVLAQLGGIVPLIGVPIQHALESEQDVADDVAAGNMVQHFHHHHAHHDDQPHDHGSSDPNDQCCTFLHHLGGVVPVADCAAQDGLLMARISVRLPRAIAGADPAPLEHPPKLPSSI
jgi:hypothetical protein